PAVSGLRGAGPADRLCPERSQLLQPVPDRWAAAVGPGAFPPVEGGLAPHPRRARGEARPPDFRPVSLFAAVSRRPSHGGTPVTRRWLAFNAVGLIGAAVQITVLAALTHGANLNYLVATALAVETAVLHNFIWHQRWTWRDRQPASNRDVFTRLVRFHF